MRGRPNAVTLAALALAVVVGIHAFLTAGPAPPQARFLAEHVDMFGMTDTAAPRTLFMAFVLATAAFGFAAAALRPRAFRWPRLPAWSLGVLALPLGFYLARSLWRTLRPPIAPAELAVALLFLALAALLLAQRRLGWAAVPARLGALLAGALLPALSPLSRTIPLAELLWVDQHMAGTFMPAELLARGKLLFQGNAPEYGLLPTVLLGLWGAMVSPVSLGALLALSQASQALMLGLVLLAARARLAGLPAPARWAGLGFVALLAVPFLSTAHPAVLYPNQSGLRFLMLPLAVLVAQRLDRMRPLPGSLLAGATAALALLHNPETGVAATIGLGTAWLLVAPRRPGAWRALLAGLLGFGLVPLLLAVAYRAAFAAWPLPTAETLGLIGKFAAGFGGLRLAWRPLPVALALLAALVFAAALRAMLRRGAPRPNPGSAAIAAMLLAWFPYWVNRPADWNLWSHIVLGALLLAPWFARQVTRPRGLLPAALVLLLLLPIPATHTRLATARLANATLHPPCADGLRFAPATCAWLNARTATLAAAPPGTVWATAYPFLAVRLANRPPAVEAADLFSATRTPEQFVALATRLRTAPLLLLDATGPAPEETAIPAPMRAFQDRLAATLGFTECAGAPGWRAFAPPGACPR
jgi:hypothetical protein